MDVRLPDGRVITNVPEGTTKSQLMARLEKYDKDLNPVLRGGGRIARNVAAGTASLADVGLLFPKTAAMGADLVLQKMGREGTPLQQTMARVGNTPTLRQQTLSGIDALTANKLKPKNNIEGGADFVMEMLTPAGIFGKAQRATNKAPTVFDAVKTTLSPQSGLEAQVKARTMQQLGNPLFAESPGNLIRLSKGQRSQSPQIQEFEDLARTGVKGPMAQQKSILFDTAQQDDTFKAFNGLLDGVDTRTGARGIFDTTDDAIKLTQKARARLKGYVDTAYSKARNASDGVAFDADLVRQGLVDTTNDALTSAGLKPNKARMPIATDLFDELASAVKPVQGQSNKALKLDALEGWRTAASQQANSLALKGTPEGLAVKTMIRQYDEFMTALADGAIREGDDQAINAFKKARALRARLGGIYQQDKIVERLTSGQGGTVESMVSDIFGAANFDSKKGAALTVKALKKASRGQEKQFTQLMKEGVVSRILDNSKSDRIIPGTDYNALSLPKLKTQLDRLLDKNGSLAKEIFTANEIKTLKALQGDLRRVKSIQPGSVNPSGSGTRVLKALAPFMRGVSATGEIAAKPVQGILNSRAATKSFENSEEVIARMTRELKVRNRNALIKPLLAGATVTGGIPLTDTDRR